MKFENFMKTEDFKDFHDYFHCSRNNKWKFSKNKFETTLEYYKHLYKIDNLDKKEYLRIFNENDISVIPIPILKYPWYIYDDVKVESESVKINNINLLNDNNIVNNFEDEENELKEPMHIITSIKTLEGNIPIPMIFRKNIRYNNIMDDIENDNDSIVLYDYLTGEENESNDSENEELF